MVISSGHHFIFEAFNPKLLSSKMILIPLVFRFCFFVRVGLAFWFLGFGGFRAAVFGLGVVGSFRAVLCGVRCFLSSFYLKWQSLSVTLLQIFQWSNPDRHAGASVTLAEFTIQFQHSEFIHFPPSRNKFKHSTTNPQVVLPVPVLSIFSTVLQSRGTTIPFHFHSCV